MLVDIHCVCVFVLYRCGVLGLGFLPFFSSSIYDYLCYTHVFHVPYTGSPSLFQQSQGQVPG